METLYLVTYIVRETECDRNNPFNWKAYEYSTSVEQLSIAGIDEEDALARAEKDLDFMHDYFMDVIFVDCQEIEKG